MGRRSFLLALVACGSAEARYTLPETVAHGKQWLSSAGGWLKTQGGRVEAAVEEVLAPQHVAAFAVWQTQHGVTYDTPEEHARRLSTYNVPPDVHPTRS
jgi:hypothetical protein